MSCSKIKALFLISFSIYWISVICCNKTGNTEKSNVKLFRSSKLTKIWRFNKSMSSWCSGILVWLLPWMKFNFLWYFNILNSSLSCIIWKFRWVNLQCDCVNCCRDNFNWFSFINFCHSFDFSQYYVVSFLENMSFVFMTCNSSGSFFSSSFFWAHSSFFNHGDDEIFGNFTIMICDNMVITIINESITPWSKCLWWDVSSIVFSAYLI